MSSTPFDLQDLLVKAAADYTRKTGVDPTHHEIVNQLQSCHSPNDVLKLLEDKANQFKHYREKNHNKLIDCLAPVVRVIHTFSNVLDKALSSVSLIGSSTVHDFTALLLGAVPTSRVDLRGRRCPPYGKSLFPHSLTTSPPNIWLPRQAASDVTSSYDALVELFECLGGFLKRLEIYSNIPSSSLMSEIIVKIIVELLSVLSLATEQIKNGIFSKWILVLNAPQLNAEQKNSQRSYLEKKRSKPSYRGWIVSLERKVNGPWPRP